MAKFFNTSGPCVSDKHYTIGMSERLADSGSNMLQLIENERYFILHAPRQTGKTTMMMNFAREITERGDYIALYVNIEAGQAVRSDVARVNKTILSDIRKAARIRLPKEYQPSPECYEIFAMDQGLSEFLTTWCLELSKPLVLFLDEVDALIGDSLISVLRQLRSGYNDRPNAFPHSVCLIGLRDIRDYRIFSDREQRHIVGGSAFNIKEKSMRLGNFSADQVARLYGQHTEETGQEFEREALEYAYRATGGQPWLVNALARETCFEEPAIAGGQTVTAEHIREAVEHLIKRRDVHLDQLNDKLTEPRVARIVEMILMGTESMGSDISNEDLQYVLDLGLVKKEDSGWEIANPIYREVIPRELTRVAEGAIGQNPSRYLTAEGRLDFEKMLAAMIEFYRNHAEMITRRKTYNEAAHHLVFMAWLHRIVNSGGRINREYAVGMGRMDLHIQYGPDRFAVELKLAGPKAFEDGKAQLTSYLQRLNLESGYLILFQRSATSPQEMGKRETHRNEGKILNVIYL